MKTYRVIISYTVTEDAYIEAESAEQAREMVTTGAIDCDWSTISTSEWDCCDIEEVD